MKVVFWSPYVGHVGTIKAVINSAKSFVQYGNHSVALIKNHSEWDGYEQEIKKAGISVYDFRLKKYFPNIYSTSPLGSRIYMILVALSGILQMYQYIRKRKPDLIVANLVVLPVIVCTLLFRFPPKLIISIQGFPKFLGKHDSDYPLWMRLEDAIRKKLWNLLYGRADLIVCMTESTKRLLIENTKLDKEKLIVINNPIVDPGMLALGSEPVIDDWLFSDESYSVLAIGRLTKQKDYNTLIRAIKIASNSISIRLAILGEGELRNELQKIIRDNSLEANVKLYGFVKNPYKYLSKVDLFVSTSLWEDPGHVLIESAYLNIPIVSTDCPSGPGVLLSHGEAGELCPVGDSECLSKKIISTLEKPKYRKVELAFKNAMKFSLEGHYRSFEAYLLKW